MKVLNLLSMRCCVLLENPETEFRGMIENGVIYVQHDKSLPFDKCAYNYEVAKDLEYERIINMTIDTMCCIEPYTILAYVNE